VASIVVLVQHYASTFNDERKYIWNAPASFAKYCYLLSRHLPILVTAVIFVLLSGFRGYTVVDEVRSHFPVSIFTSTYVTTSDMRLDILRCGCLPRRFFHDQ
jgi:hypothetical protein